ncbi:MAG: hypothetical protein ACI9MC_000191 [Kiritimatiellia bacterium]|jgi:hypothetical protein
MPNQYLPRPIVHDWSEDIGKNTEAHQAALSRLLKDQRRLTRWLEENAENMEGGTGGVAAYLFGVVARMFDLAGGRMRKATWEQVRQAERSIGGAAGSLLPFDASFPDRVRKIEWRAQPHILDEALMSLFEREPTEEEEDLDTTEAGKIFFLLWVATEVIDQNWTPAKDTELLETYEYLHIEPMKKEG